jgi:hypothetical protein
MMKRRLLVVALLAAALGGVAGWEVRSFLAIDSCLDAGGRWEYQGDHCEGI